MKRSSHVALLLMGVGSIGAAGYAMTPQRDCTAPAQQSTAAMRPAVTDGTAQTPCASRSSSSGSSSHGSHWSRPIFSGSRGTAAPATSAARSGSSTVAALRGGFGSIAHAFSAHSGG